MEYADGLTKSIRHYLATEDGGQFAADHFEVFGLILEAEKSAQELGLLDER